MIELHSDGWPKMHLVLPDGATNGFARIHHRVFTEEDRAREELSQIVRPGRSMRRIPAVGDVITQLIIRDTVQTPRDGGRLWMSDVPDERRDHWSPRHHAKGNVLIGGLGLGMVALACALKPEVERLTVVEIEPSVIGLVAPLLDKALGELADKVAIVEADVFEWKPPKGELYDMVWMDVWGDVSTDDLGEHTKLFRRFGRRVKPGGYIGCWKNETLRYHAGLRPRRRRRKAA